MHMNCSFQQLIFVQVCAEVEVELVQVAERGISGLGKIKLM